MVCQYTLNAIAYAALGYFMYRLFKVFYNIFYPFFVAPAADLHRLAGGKWAVVTGATDGIGKAYAFELARKGFNIIIVSRTQSKLDETSKEIKEKHSTIDVKTISFDFTNSSVEDYEKHLINELKKYEIGILGELLLVICANSEFM